MGRTLVVFVSECGWVSCAGCSDTACHTESSEDDTADHGGLFLMGFTRVLYLIPDNLLQRGLHASISYTSLSAVCLLRGLAESELPVSCLLQINLFQQIQLHFFFLPCCLEVSCSSPGISSLLTQMNKQWKLSPKCEELECERMTCVFPSCQYESEFKGQ